VEEANSGYEKKAACEYKEMKQLSYQSNFYKSLSEQLLQELIRATSTKVIFMKVASVKVTYTTIQRILIKGISEKFSLPGEQDSVL
jgi:hypothetical protein